jgi:hypothetical protein
MFLKHYAAQLMKEVEAKRALRAQPSQPLSLRERLEAWYRSLPAVSRDRRFSMAESEAALKTQGKYISPVLLELAGGASGCGARPVNIIGIGCGPPTWIDAR